VASSLSWIKKIFVHNWKLKLLATFVAILSYYAIRGFTRYEKEHDIAVEVKVAEEGIAILDQDPMAVRVRFRGSHEYLLRLDQRQLKVVVNAKTDSPDGAEYVEIRPRNVEGASGVSVVKIDPPIVHLTFDREIEMTVPVARPTTSGTPLIGDVEVDFEPDSVSIRGPRRALSDVKIVKTEPIDVEGRGASFSTRAKVFLPGDTGVTQIEPPEIKVRVNIVTELISRGWTNISVLAVVERGLTCDVSFDPALVDVFLHGRAEVLDSIPENAVKVFVDCIELHESGTRILPVNVHLPAGLDVNATVEPKTVRVIFRRVVPAGEEPASADPEPIEVPTETREPSVETVE
jgi:YbbR domain-containing protein